MDRSWVRNTLDGILSTPACMGIWWDFFSPILYWPFLLVIHSRFGFEIRSSRAFVWVWSYRASTCIRDVESRRRKLHEETLTRSCHLRPRPRRRYRFFLERESMKFVRVSDTPWMDIELSGCNRIVSVTSFVIITAVNRGISAILYSCLSAIQPFNHLTVPRLIKVSLPAR